MKESSKVVVRIEYEQNGKQKVCYCEVEEAKLKNFEAGEEDFICKENDGTIMWLDKKSLIARETLHIKSVILLKPKITDYIRVDGKTDEDA